jgi:hypothetical protein
MVMKGHLRGTPDSNRVGGYIRIWLGIRFVVLVKYWGSEYNQIMSLTPFRLSGRLASGNKCGRKNVICQALQFN